jgi:putative methionine-R-sulfoxide reductase with GAF domain
MSPLTFINDLGKSKENDTATNTAIAFTNWISVIVILASIGCTFLSYSLSGKLVVISWLFTAINASSLVLTACGLFLAARYVLNIGPSIYLALLHIAIKQPGQDIITSVLLIQIGMLSVPWIMFKASEKWKLHLVNTINLACIYISVYVSGQNNLEFDNSIYVSGIGVDFGLIICTFGSIIIISFVNWTNHKGQQDIQTLLTEVENKNLQMQHDQLQLKEYILKVEEAQEVEKRRQWATQALADISELMRTRRSTENLFDQLLSAIVKTLSANQGALFLTESHERATPALVLKACYAYNRKKYQHIRIEAGEGLLGQCFLEKHIIYLTDIPQGYTRITSGLGNATPTSLIIVPLMSDDRVEGILEIASFQNLHPHEVKYLEQVASILGSFIFQDSMLKTRNTIAEGSINGE